jgi:hypothetical protein
MLKPAAGRGSIGVGPPRSRHRGRLLAAAGLAGGLVQAVEPPRITRGSHVSKVQGDGRDGEQHARGNDS